MSVPDGNRSMTAVRHTTDWPCTEHLCQGAGGVARSLRFGGGICKDGLEVQCPGCGLTIVYIRPKARRDDMQPAGGRTHF